MAPLTIVRRNPGEASSSPLFSLSGADIDRAAKRIAPVVTPTPCNLAIGCRRSLAYGLPQAQTFADSALL